MRNFNFAFLSLFLLNAICFAGQGTVDGHSKSGGDTLSEKNQKSEAFGDREKNLLDKFQSSRTMNSPKLKFINDLPNDELKSLAKEVCKDTNFFITQIGNEMIKKTDLSVNPVYIYKTFASYEGAVPYYIYSEKYNKNCNDENNYREPKELEKALSAKKSDVKSQNDLKLLQKSKLDEGKNWVSIYPIPYKKNTDTKNSNCSSHFEVELDKSGRLIANIKDSQGIKSSVLCAENVKLGYVKDRNPPLMPSFTLPIEVPIQVENPVTKNNSEK